jgi:4-hydroxybenzoyl-CoA thioesterase/acyl-CoA thioester hydrolase
MSNSFRARRRVEFHDTDAAGIMHFASFFVLMEQAEHEFLRHVGLSVYIKQGEEKFSWPRVSVKCDYQAPAYFEDELDIDVWVAKLGTKSITYAFRVVRGLEVLATGEFTAVFCQLIPKEKPRSLAIPDDIREKLLPYVA